MIGALFATMKPFAPPPPPNARPAPLGERLQLGKLERDVLEVTAFERPGDYAQHFTERYGPTIAVRANAARDGHEAEFDRALAEFCDEWNRGTPEDARFEMEYLIAVGTRSPG